MSKFKNDITDDEIRIIRNTETSRRRRKKPRLNAIIAGVAAIIVIAILFFINRSDDRTQSAEAPASHQDEIIIENESPSEIASTTLDEGAASVEVLDTVVDGSTLTLLFPNGCVPTLEIGSDALNDSTAMLICQAADVRKDNGGIVGAFVKDGELLSRGQSKAGFCAIIDGRIAIGTAINTAYLEKAIESGGCFFRQYSLVVEGQPIENKPKGKSLRKALANIDGRVCVVLSRERLTFTEFAQALADIGTKNAIYLVGSKSYGFYKDDAGNRVPFGTNQQSQSANVNYIVWR